jgi:hypothetical protein
VLCACSRVCDSAFPSRLEKVMKADHFCQPACRKYRALAARCMRVSPQPEHRGKSRRRLCTRCAMPARHGWRDPWRRSPAPANPPKALVESSPRSPQWWWAAREVILADRDPAAAVRTDDCRPQLAGSPFGKAGKHRAQAARPTARASHSAACASHQSRLEANRPVRQCFTISNRSARHGAQPAARHAETPRMSERLAAYRRRAATLGHRGHSVQVVGVKLLKDRL